MIEFDIQLTNDQRRLYKSIYWMNNGGRRSGRTTLLHMSLIEYAFDHECEKIPLQDHPHGAPNHGADSHTIDSLIRIFKSISNPNIHKCYKLVINRRERYFVVELKDVDDKDICMVEVR